MGRAGKGGATGRGGGGGRGLWHRNKGGGGRLGEREKPGGGGGEAGQPVRQQKTCCMPALVLLVHDRLAPSTILAPLPLYCISFYILFSSFSLPHLSSRYTCIPPLPLTCSFVDSSGQLKRHFFPFTLCVFHSLLPAPLWCISSSLSSDQVSYSQSISILSTSLLFHYRASLL